MKKLFLIILVLLTVVSCKQEEPVEDVPLAVKDYAPIANWDVENIAYLDTPTIRSVGDTRLSGTSGIIGEFGGTDAWGSGSIFYYTNGYYEKTGYYYDGNFQKKSNFDYGTYVIKKSEITDDYYLIMMRSLNDKGNVWYFYQVTSAGLAWNNSIIINGVGYEAKNYF